LTTVVIGVGNRYRHDDGAGPVVADRLHELSLAGVRVIETDGEPTRLLDAWDGASVAVVVDAVRTGTAPAGAVHRAEAPLSPGRPRAGSSHALGLGDAYALGEALGRLPRRLVVYGIEAVNFDTGTGLSDAVAAAVNDVVAAVAADIGGDPPCA